jgi:deoxyribodipyrimidine photolyase-related protein
MSASSGKILRVVLGDQLNLNHSWFKEDPSSFDVLMMEVKEEASYVTHHIQKIVAFFAAMRAFAVSLQGRGVSVLYTKLSDSPNSQTLSDEIKRIVFAGEYSSVEYQEPDEYRVRSAFEALKQELSIPVRCVSTEHFLTTPQFFSQLFKGKKRYVMETFYRSIRRERGYLMQGDEPIGEKWNFDAENRKKLPRGHVPPPPLEFSHDVSDILLMIQSENIPSIGSIAPTSFSWPLTREEALQTLDYFCKHLLPNFGLYQDAMHTDYPFIYHSKLSFSLNVKHLSPHEIISKAIEAYELSGGTISLAQIEGFVRQIAGWREFMRGVYWNHMPEYETLNELEADRKLPRYFWDANTKMNCVHHAVKQSLETGYAHHIQRLMVTGNFALLAGIDPNEVDQWYLGIYIDALQWVQLPNTRGMSQYADGGIVGTKPYMSSGAYINKMSNYCAGCHYSHKERYGEKGCPFNSLYWDFLMRHESKLSSNPRIGMGYQLLKKMPEKEKADIRTRASEVLSKLEEL